MRRGGEEEGRTFFVSCFFFSSERLNAMYDNELLCDVPVHRREGNSDPRPLSVARIVEHPFVGENPEHGRGRSREYPRPPCVCGRHSPTLSIDRDFCLQMEDKINTLEPEKLQEYRVLLQRNHELQVPEIKEGQRGPRAARVGRCDP